MHTRTPSTRRCDVLTAVNETPGPHTCFSQYHSTEQEPVSLENSQNPGLRQGRYEVRKKILCVYIKLRKYLKNAGVMSEEHGPILQELPLAKSGTTGALKQIILLVKCSLLNKIENYESILM